MGYSNIFKNEKGIKSFISFNKEILFGEVGALVGTQSFGYFGSRFFSSPNYISGFVVLGAVICASLFWFLARFYDRRIRKNKSTKMVAKEISYFAPASVLLTVGVYYPTLFYSTRYLLTHHDVVAYSAIVSQAIAFTMFAIGINTYRYILIKLKKIVL